jgi:hypothetical protein
VVDSVVYKAQESTDRKSAKLVTAIRAAAGQVEPAPSQTIGELLDELRGVAGPKLPPGARRTLRYPISMADDYLVGTEKSRPLFEAVEVERGGPPPADLVQHAGWALR